MVDAKRAGRGLTDTVATRLRAQLVVDEGQLEALAEHHSRQSMLVEPSHFESMSDPGALESVVCDTYRYHYVGLGKLETLLGRESVESLFLEMRGLYDPVTGDRPMDACELRLVPGFRPSADPEDQLKHLAEEDE